MIKGWAFCLVALVSVPAYSADFDLPLDEDVIHVYGEPSATRLPETFRVLSWNIEKAGKEVTWVRDFKNLSSQSDVVLLQEAHWNDYFRWGMAEAPGFAWLSITSFEWRGLPTGVVSGTRSTLWNPGWLRSVDREPITATPKMMGSFEAVLADDRKVLVMNIHGLNFTVGGEFRRQMTAAFNVVRAYQGPVVFGGDFNTWNGDRTKWLLGQVREHGMVEAVPKTEPRLRILDRVFVRDLKVMSAEVLRAVNSSDHWPLSVEVSSSAF